MFVCCFWVFFFCIFIFYFFVEQLWAKLPGGALWPAEALLAQRVLFKDWCTGNRHLEI